MAVRVAIGKIKAIVDANGGALPVLTVAGGANAVLSAQQTLSTTSPGTFTGSIPGVSAGSHSAVAVPDVAGSGLNWSGLGGSSTMSASGVAVADAASSAVLTSCTKCLAKAVGPMAKVFVKEAVRRVTAGQPFSKGMLSALVNELEKEIEDRADAAEFRKNALKIS